MAFVLFGLLSMMCAAPAFATDEITSVFFTPEEMAKIASPGEKPDVAPADIHLGAVFYYGPDSWTLWIDNVRWTPETRRTDLQVMEVSAGRVRLMLTRLDGSSQTIVLKPHQTWRAATGKVVEGMR